MVNPRESGNTVSQTTAPDTDGTVTEPCETSVREMNRRLARLEYEEGRTILQSKPRALFIELTRHCNLACPMCRYPGEVPPTQRMSEALFARVEAELFPTADLIDLRGWGESLILPEFPDRARRASRHGASLRVVTNLSFRRDAVLDLLADLGFYVGVSIDSADAEVVSFLRGGAKLSIIEANLARLGERYRALGLQDRLNLYVTLQAPALPALEQIIDLAARHGIEDVRLAPVGTSLAFLSLSPVKTELVDALDRVRRRAAATNVRVSVTASPLEGMLPNENTGACVHPWMWCYVTYEGRIGFCDHLIAADHYTLGSLRTDAFDQIWNGAAWVALREEHLRDRRASAPHFHECAWCYRNRHVDCEDIVEPSQAVHRLTLHPRRAAPGTPRADRSPAPANRV
jgi:MoaA/NifB/PqqE/SkfB family radical SAM enzyme